MSRWSLVATAVVMTACRPTVEPAVPMDEPKETEAFDPSPLEPLEPANKAAGDQIDLLVPGVESEFIDLADLRGKTVILALSGTQEASWAELLAWMEAVQAEAPESRVSVLVAADPEADALDAILSPVRLGWDPQGAVAARLSVARLPTVFLIDPQGQLLHVSPGFGELERSRLDALLAETP